MVSNFQTVEFSIGKASGCGRCHLFMVRAQLVILVNSYILFIFFCVYDQYFAKVKVSAHIIFFGGAKREAAKLPDEWLFPGGPGFRAVS